MTNSPCEDNIHIKEYTEKDKTSILNLLGLNTPIYFSPEEETDLIYYLDNEIESYFVVELEGKVVGCGGFNLQEDSTIGYISWDILHPDYQGKGIGSFLLNYRLDKLKKNQNIEQIIVRTTPLAYKVL